MSQLKRFVAGVVCPRCARMDTTRVNRDDEREYRECVSCGFEDSMRLDGRPEPRELQTRVSGEGEPAAVEAKQSDDTAAQPIKFFVNPKLQKRDH